jgi:hypothetical protein
MANTILSSALSAPALSITSDLTSVNVATGLAVSKVSLKLRARIFRHKREDGTTIVDARQVEPMITEAEVFAPTLDNIASIRSSLMDRQSTYTVKSRGLVMRRMMMDECDIKQTGDMISASPVRMVFKELLTQNQSNVGQTTVAQPADSTLIDKGLQQVRSAVIDATQLAQSFLTQIYPPSTQSFLDGSWFLDGTRYLDGSI